MARKVKCQICKKELTNDIAFKVYNGKKNLYYCSEEEYMEYKKDSDARKDLMKFIAIEVLNYEQAQLLPKVLIKKISELHRHYSYEIILETFKKQEENLKYWMSLENKFNNEYQKVNYMIAIISNNINDVFESYKTKNKMVKEIHVKCEICNKELIKNLAFKKVEGSKISYYCSEKEYEEYKSEIECKQSLFKYVAKEILNYDECQLLPKKMIKQILSLYKHYSYEIILETFKNQEKNLKYWMNLENKFGNEQHRVDYIMAIISNNINDIFELHKTKEKMVEKEHKTENEIIDTNIMNNIIQRKRKVTDISEFLD